MLTLTIMAWPEGETPGDSLLTVPAAGATLGRASACTLCLADQQRLLSRSHARLLPQQEGWAIQDTSRNGVRVNGQLMNRGSAGQRTLADGDLLALGGYQLLVSLPPEQSPAVVGADAGTDAGAAVKTEPEPPLLTDRISSDTGVFEPGPVSRSYPMPREYVSEPLPFTSMSSGPVRSLSSIDALADEVLREFSPGHLQHKLGPWRGRGLRRKPWWQLYRSYHSQLERSGDLHMRLREWFLRSGQGRRDHL